MASITGSQLINKATLLLNDPTNIRWPRPELLNWLNDGQREVAMIKPEASLYTGPFMLNDWVTQSIATFTIGGVTYSGLVVIDVVRCLTSINPIVGGPAIRLTSSEILNTINTGWRASNAYGLTKHYTFDPRNPKYFDVYPPSNYGQPSYVEIVASVAPVNTDDAGKVIGLDDIYANALLDYILYRAYGKDATYAQNAQLADLHAQVFASSIGTIAPQIAAGNPNLLGGIAGNPNVPRIAQTK